MMNSHFVWLTVDTGWLFTMDGWSDSSLSANECRGGMGHGLAVAWGGHKMEMKDQERFRRMVQYIAFQGKDDAKLGVTKLNKLLYFADFTAYRETGQSISGIEYEHWKEGPVPRDMNLVEQRPYHGHGYTRSRSRVWARRKPAMGIFTDEEVAILDRIITRYRDVSAEEISDLSRLEPGWLLTRAQEVIPYETAWLAPTKLTPYKIEHARSLAETYGVGVGVGHTGIDEQS